MTQPLTVHAGTVSLRAATLDVLEELASAGSIGQLLFAWNMGLFEHHLPSRGLLGETIRAAMTEAARALPEPLVEVAGDERIPCACFDGLEALVPDELRDPTGGEIVRPGLALDFLLAGLARVAMGPEPVFWSLFDHCSSPWGRSPRENGIEPHTDGADTVWLAAVRGLPEARTSVTTLGRLLGALRPGTRDVLLQPRYHIVVRDSFSARFERLTGVRSDGPIPLVVEEAGRRRLHPLARVYFGLVTRSSRGVDPEAEAARLALVAEAHRMDHYTHRVLVPGQLMILRCRDTLHRVTSHGPGRWLVRMETLCGPTTCSDPTRSYIGPENRFPTPGEVDQSDLRAHLRSLTSQTTPALTELARRASPPRSRHAN